MSRNQILRRLRQRRSRRRAISKPIKMLRLGYLGRILQIARLAEGIDRGFQKRRKIKLLIKMAGEVGFVKDEQGRWVNGRRLS